MADLDAEVMALAAILHTDNSLIDLLSVEDFTVSEYKTIFVVAKERRRVGQPITCQAILEDLEYCGKLDKMPSYANVLEQLAKFHACPPDQDLSMIQVRILQSNRERKEA